MTERPTCRACSTAATGGGAPSNRRRNTRLPSCSYELPPPGRKFFTHALHSGKIFCFGSAFRTGRSAFSFRPPPSPVPPACSGPSASATGRWPAIAPGSPLFSFSWRCLRPVSLSFVAPRASPAATAGTARPPPPAACAPGRCPSGQCSRVCACPRCCVPPDSSRCSCRSVCGWRSGASRRLPRPVSPS